MKLIQLGLSFMNEDGKTPEEADAYQFNFRFNLSKEFQVASSIALLRQHGIDFQRFCTEGISPIYFSYQFAQSGLLTNKKLRWIFFHGSYDMGYLVKQVTLADLPPSSSEFVELFQKYFPNVVDLKVSLDWSSSLAKLMEESGVPRRGESHQAGSDALGTVEVYLARRERDRQRFDENVGIIYDINQKKK